MLQISLVVNNDVYFINFWWFVGGEISYEIKPVSRVG